MLGVNIAGWRGRARPGCGVGRIRSVRWVEATHSLRAGRRSGEAAASLARYRIRGPPMATTTTKTTTTRATATTAATTMKTRTTARTMTTMGPTVAKRSVEPPPDGEKKQRKKIRYTSPLQRRISSSLAVPMAVIKWWCRTQNIYCGADVVPPAPPHAPPRGGGGRGWERFCPSIPSRPCPISPHLSAP